MGSQLESPTNKPQTESSQKFPHFLPDVFRIVLVDFIMSHVPGRVLMDIHRGLSRDQIESVRMQIVDILELMPSLTRFMLLVLIW